MEPGGAAGVLQFRVQHGRLEQQVSNLQQICGPGYMFEFNKNIQIRNSNKKSEIWKRAKIDPDPDPTIDH